MLTLRDHASMTALRDIAVLEEMKPFTTLYDLIAARIKPEELLFLLTNPPEVPLPDTYSTTVNGDTVLVNNENLIIDTVNHIVNRILYDGNKFLSYQEVVYLETALSKLGITNTSVFLKKAFTMIEESRNTLKLLQVYDAHAKVNALEGAEQERYERVSEKSETVQSERERYFLHRDIFDRLQSELIYQEVSEFAKESAYYEHYINTCEMYVLETKKLSHLIRLDKHRHSLFVKSPLAFTYNHNDYVTGAELTLPQTPAQVTAQASAAALAEFIDLCFMARVDSLRNHLINSVDIRYALRDAGRDSITRFISYGKSPEMDAALARTKLTESLNTRLIKENNIILSIAAQSDKTFNKEAFTDIVKNISEFINYHDTEYNDNVDPAVNFTANATVQTADKAQIESRQSFEKERVIYNDTLNNEQIRESLIETDRQNRERLERMNEITTKLDAVKKPKPVIDRERILRESLLALNNPETVYHRTWEKEKTEIIHKAEHEMMEMLLENADEASRDAIERLMFIEKQSETIHQAASFDSVEMINIFNDTITQINAQNVQNVFNESELRKSAQGNVAARYEHIQSEKRFSERKNTKEVLELIHKIERIEETKQENVIEKTVESLQEQVKSQQSVQTIETETIRLQESTMEKLTQDMTELVNRTVLKQLNVISDKVYGQLEKRLSGERMRRGR